MEKTHGKQIFSNFKLKMLKKMTKDELKDHIGSNLIPLVDYYFYDSYRGEERKYEPLMLDLISSMKYFIKPISKIVTDRNFKDEVPEGLHVMLVDYLEKLYSRIEKSLQTSPDIVPSQEEREAQKQAIEVWKELRDVVTSVVRVSAKKTIKKLMKLGINEEYAIDIAANIVPSEYLNKFNVRKYIFRLNQSLYKVQKRGVERVGDNKYTVHIGAELNNPEVLKAIYLIALDDADTEIVQNALVGIALEKKTRALETFTVPQMAVYNAISRLALSILEGETLFAPQVNEAKLSKKELKKAKKEYLFGKSELKGFFKSYRVERIKDAKKGRDGVRRIQFDTLNPEDYTNVCKVYKKYLGELTNELIQSTPKEKEAVEKDMAKAEEKTKEKRKPGRPKKTDKKSDK